MVNLRHSCLSTQSEGAKTFITQLYKYEELNYLGFRMLTIS